MTRPNYPPMQCLRTVRPGGIVRFLGSNYQSDKLLPYVGQRVMCRDMLSGELQVNETWTVREHRLQMTRNGRHWRNVTGRFIAITGDGEI